MSSAINASSGIPACIVNTTLAMMSPATSASA